MEQKPEPKPDDQTSTWKPPTQFKTVYVKRMGVLDIETYPIEDDEEEGGSPDPV